VRDSSETRYATPRLRRAATRLLAQETGGGPATSESLAAASGRLLDKLSQGLAQVIGPAGVQSIFLRAVRLRKSEFPFLDERIVPSDNRGSLAEPLHACLQEHEPEVIREASVALFATFAGLLATVIGDRLTWSLLQQIWSDTLLPRTELLQETEQ
jgi:hypothetical protein